MIPITQSVIYEGRVQGVGFRYCAKEVAKGYEVTGWIKNLPSGTVEMAVKGDEQEVREFIAASILRKRQFPNTSTKRINSTISELLPNPVCILCPVK